MDRPVWITGAQGFIGSHLARELVTSGAYVVGFRRASTPISAASGNHTSYPHSPDGFRVALRDHGSPQRVYHLAGGGTVGQSISNPHEDFLSNVVTTETLLEALRGSNVPVVFASSAAVYGEGRASGESWNENLAPWSPYGHHKIMAEHLLRTHAQSFGLRATVLRLFSIYGPGIRKQLLYDACLRLSASSPTAPLILGGTGHERRDWLEISDVIDAMVTVKDPEPGKTQIFNLASGSSSKIRDVACSLVSAWGGSHEVVFSNISRKGDPFSLVADPSSLPPDFLPRIALDEGISRFVSWFHSEVARINHARRVE